jgi:hypothetical protein
MNFAKRIIENRQLLVFNVRILIYNYMFFALFFALFCPRSILPTLHVLLEVLDAFYVHFGHLIQDFDIVFANVLVDVFKLFDLPLKRFSFQFQCLN